MATRMKRFRSPTATKAVRISTDFEMDSKNHSALVEYIRYLFGTAKSVRDTNVTRFTHIDREMAGFLLLDEDDRKRQRDVKQGRGIKIFDTSLPLTVTQIDEAITFLMTVIASEEGLYSAIARKDQQAVAKGFSLLMNEHARKYQHVRHICKFLLNAFKYNIAGMIVEWNTMYGTKLGNTPAGTAEVLKNVPVYAGNKLTAADMYNFFYDSTIDPIDLPKTGEFFGTVDKRRLNSLKREEQIGRIFGAVEAAKAMNPELSLFATRPEIRNDGETQASNQGTNFDEVFAAYKPVDGSPFEDKVAEEEIIYMWLNPHEAKIKPIGGATNRLPNESQIWKFRLINMNRIVEAEMLNNAHGMLPCVITMPWEDDFREQTQSFAELLLPSQRFASHQINVHQRANRKALAGFTVFNKSVVDLTNVDVQCGKFGVDAPADFDFRKAIYQSFDAPGTEYTMRDVEAMITLMQKILPTDQLRQVAGLERATQYQAAATVQGGNRRNVKFAKTIDDQALSVGREMQMYNVLEKQETVELIDPNGEIVQVNPSELRDAKLEFTISDGLKGIDKLSLIMNLKDIMNSLLQSQDSQQKVDIIAMLNYITTLQGDKTDLNQFKYKSAIDALPPQQKELAFQLLQQYAAQQEAASGQKPGPKPNA